jgi:hypothetical protein
MGIHVIYGSDFADRRHFSEDAKVSAVMLHIRPEPVTSFWKWHASRVRLRISPSQVWNFVTTRKSAKRGRKKA